MEEPRCSFCGRPQSETKSIIQGKDGAFICDECVKNCWKIVGKESDIPDWNPDNLPTPKEIKEKLDQYVIGQEEAKKTMSVAVYNHYKRLASNDDNDVEIQKSNVLLVGPTGSGKTLIARTLAKIIDVPFVIADATTLTQAGYIGDDVETVLLKLIQAADGNIEEAQRGIVYIDEIDKIAKPKESPTHTKSANEEGVQQSLLKIIEGANVSVPIRSGFNQTSMDIDTTNILFICGGAFDDLDKIVNKENEPNPIGFNSEVEDIEEKEADPQDFIQYGLIPELIGRLPIIVTLDTLTEKDLISILTEPKNAIIKQYQKLFEMDGVSLKFDQEALSEIAKISLSRKTGARGLRAVIEKMMNQTMYDIPSDKAIKECRITKNVITNGQPPIFMREEGNGQKAESNSAQ